MLQDRINQDGQHNIRQDNTAYNRRLCDDPQVMSPNRPEEDAPMVNPLNGPQNEQGEPEVLLQQNTLIQQVVHFEYDRELRHLHLVQDNDASIEQIIQEILQIKRTMGHMSQVLTESFSLAFEVTPRIRTRICMIWPVKWSYRRPDCRKSQQRLREFHVQSWNR